MMLIVLSLVVVVVVARAGWTLTRLVRALPRSNADFGVEWTSAPPGRSEGALTPSGGDAEGVWGQS